VPTTVQLDVAEVSRVGSTSYRKLLFESQGSSRPFWMELFATPDLRFLARELPDSRVDPAEEERQK
jgi:hypothetical protein